MTPPPTKQRQEKKLKERCDQQSETRKWLSIIDEFILLFMNLDHRNFIRFHALDPFNRDHLVTRLALEKNKKSFCKNILKNHEAEKFSKEYRDLFNLHFDEFEEKDYESNNPVLSIKQFETTASKHFYGKLLANGENIELMRNVTVKDVYGSGEDFKGFEVGHETNRFNSKEQLKRKAKKILSKMKIVRHLSYVS